MMSSLRDYRKNTKRQTPTNQRKTQGHLQISIRVPPHCFRLASLAENAIHQESPAVGCPPYVANIFGVPFKLFWFYYTLRRAGHLAILHIFRYLIFLENTE
jgi:hypothetical protein